MFIKKQKENAQNLLDLQPARALKWETEGNGQVVLLVPKFRKGPLATWLMPRITIQNIRVKLDEHGSFVWKLCDGKTTVYTISEKIKEKFGDDFDPNYERVGKFITQLTRDKFLALGEQPIQ
jgi:hypothetical protein